MDIEGTLKVALIQMSFGEELALSLVKTAAKNGAKIICLPELFFSYYFPQSYSYSSDDLFIPDSEMIIKPFIEIAKEFSTVIIVPVIEKKSSALYNSAVVIDADGTIFPSYHKVHLPHDPLFWERSYFTPGDKYLVYNTKYGKIAVLICFDQWFPEAAREVSLMGADIIFYPTAIGTDSESDSMAEAWQIVQRSHAIVNSVHVAAVNRVGVEKDLLFFGGSFICDSFGRVISKAGCVEEIVYADVTLADNRSVSDCWGFMRNRRPDTYKLIEEPVDSKTVTITPRSSGYKMPAEFEKHEAVWLSWPYNDMTFPRLPEVEKTYIRFIKAVSRGEQVHLLVRNEDTREKLTLRFKEEGISAESVNMHIFEYDDVWIRDYGPIFVVNSITGDRAMVRWHFNSWGNKYEGQIIDDGVPDQIFKIVPERVFYPGIVLEGGSVEVNGKGTIITTKSCLLNENRNKGLGIFEIEDYLSEYFGAVNIIWLEGGIAGDDTDGHIDNLARFVSPSTVLCAFEEDESSENYYALKENYDVLLRSLDQDGNKLNIIKMPMPGVVTDGFENYPASYMNFYIGNSVVIVPVYDDPNDWKALSILREFFEGREVIGIDARAMVEGYGTFHCASQQQPSIHQ